MRRAKKKKKATRVASQASEFAVLIKKCLDFGCLAGKEEIILLKTWSSANRICNVGQNVN